LLARDHCGRGHKYTPENTCIRSDGSRCCRTCKNYATRRAKETR
jgi:hypothetical protein